MRGERKFFEGLAATWDLTRKEDAEKLTELVQAVGIQPGDAVLDIGSGTGVLIPYLYRETGSTGKITAVDFSEAMIKKSQEKHKDMSNVEFFAEDIMEWQSEERYDAVVCLNFLPHMRDKLAFFRRVQGHLKTAGVLAILHDLSREEVNSIHGKSREVAEDRLPEADVVAGWLEESGYMVQGIIDQADRYFIRAQRNG